MKCANTPPADPTISASLNHSWPVIHLVVFLISGRGYHILYRYTTERVEEKNKQGLGLAPSARKGEVCDTFCAFGELKQACTWVKTLTKPLAMLTCLLALVNPAYVGQQVLAVVFLTPVLLSSLPCLHLLTASFCSLLSTNSCCLLWDLRSLVHFQS